MSIKEGITKLIIIIAVLLLAGSSKASIMHVCPSGCDHSSIQEAIDVASPGDSIEVQSGFYNEQATINKDVTLKGIDTGEGLPLIYVTYLCNHPESAVSGIESILLGGCPEKGISIYNNTVGIRTAPESNKTAVIAPSLDFKGDPSYVVELQANKSKVNKGDYFGIGLFISGAGEVNSSKLRVSIPPYIVQNEIVNLGELNFSGKGHIAPNKTMPLNPKYSIHTFNSTLVIITLSPIYFINYSNSLMNVGENPFPIQKNKYYPPFTIEFKISDNAPPGDHNIYVNLFYKKKDKWLLDREIVPIHVRYWYEGDTLQWFVYLALILGAGASAIKIYNFVIERKRKKV